MSAATTTTPSLARYNVASTPIGPHPRTGAVSPATGRPRLTACMPMDAGSPSAAISTAGPAGTGHSFSTATATSSAMPPSS